MPEFLQLLPPSEALNRLLSSFNPHVYPETIDTRSALYRVTVESIYAPHPLPAFDRSTVDGYAVHAADTHGASESLPAYLKIAGEAPMGAKTEISLARGECALIHTGGMLPGGADAVIMVEHTQSARPGEVEALRAAAVGENVLKVGEDVRAGEVVIPAGSTLRPAEIGGLMALGITRVDVARQPRAAILSSGDEVIPPDMDPKPGQVRDVNTYSLSALIEAAGGFPLPVGIVPDEIDAMRHSAHTALERSDLLIITAGSSASARDLTALVINSLGTPGVLVHGVNVRPGKPTILAVCNGKPVIGLPGNPVSALVIAQLFVIPVIEALQGIRRVPPMPTIQARLTLNLASQAGREDWVAVQLVQDSAGYSADPVFGKSNLIFTLARADGLVRIPPDATGLEAGQMVDVILL